jgi:hypothetical protein
MNVAVLTTILRAIDNVTPVVTKMQRDVSASLGAVKNLIAGALSAAAVLTAVKAFQDLTGKLTDLGAKTGVSASAMHGFKLVFEQAGVSIDAVASSINQMQARLVSGDGGAVGAMKQLGLNAADLVRMQPDAAFTKVADAIGRVENPASKARLAMDAFGRGGLALLPGLNGKLGETVGAFERMGLVLSDEVIAAGDDFGDTMTVLEAAGMALVANVLTPMLPALTWLAQSFGSLAANFIPAAQRAFDDMVAAGMRALAWVYEFVAGILDAGAKVPLLGRALGAVGANADYFRQQAQHMNDAAAAMAVEVPKAEAAVARMPPPLRDTAAAMQRAAEVADILEKTLRNLRWDAYAEQQDAIREAVSKTTAELIELVEAEGAADVTTIGIVASTENWSRALEQLKPGLTDTKSGAKGLADVLKNDLSSSLAKIPGLITAAMTGGGGASGALKAVGSELGGQLGDTLGQFAAKAVGGKLGSLLGSAGGPVGAALGSLAGSAAGKLLSGMFGKGEGRQTNDLRDKFVSAAGGINELNVKAQAAGMTLDKLLNAKNVRDYEAAVRDLQGAFAQQEADQQLLNATVEKYGLTLADLGPKFAQGRIVERSKELLNEWRVLEDAGADMTAVASKMAPEVGKFIEEAIRSGTTVPKELEPIIAAMLETGQLTDAAGEKFTDMSQIPFAKDVNASLLAVAEKLDIVVSKLADGLAGAFDAAAAAGEAMAGRVNRAIGGIRARVDIDYTQSGGDPGFAGGTRSRYGRWFNDFGSEFPTRLHGDEAVVTRQQAPEFARDVLGGSGGGGMVHNDFRGAIVPDYAGMQRLADMMARATNARASASRVRVSIATARS